MAPSAPLTVALAVALVGVASALAMETLVNRRVLEGQAGYSDIINNVHAYELHDFDLHQPTRRALSSAGEKFVKYDLHVLGRRMTLELERYDSLFSKDYEHHYLGEDNKVIKTEKAPNCIYKGVVAGDESARATVSLCNGMIHATLHHDKDESEDFTIQPLDPLQKETTQHVAYRHRDLVSIEKFCGNDKDDTNPVDPIVEANGRLRRLNDKSDSHHKDHNHDTESTTVGGTTARRNLQAERYVGINVMNDFTRYQQKSFTVHQHSAQLFAVANSLYAKLGTVTPSTFKINLEIARMYTLTSSNPWTEIANSPTAPPAGSLQVRTSGGEWNADDLLKAFNSYTNQPQFPIAPLNHLLTGTTFITSTIGLAFVGGTCSGSSVSLAGRQQSGETQATAISDAHISSTIAHEIGHNLGAQHTNVVPPGIPSCAPTVEAIMSASSSFGFTNWEACTVKYFTDFLTPSTGACTTSASSTLFQGTPVCGDGLVQGSEQCDCIGGNCAGIDPCCNGATCQLNPGADCSSLDTCCTGSCTIRPAGLSCRAATGSCDIPEFCTGTSGRCPIDTFNETGTPCTTPVTSTAGRCFAKKCLSRAEECQARGVENSKPWNNACSSSECIVSCGTGSPASSCENFVPNQNYKDGTPCSSTQACFGGLCTDFALIPVPLNPNCSNGVVDQNETDLDCGGPACFGCAAGKLCFADKDCLNGACNKTATVDQNGYVGLGTCVTVIRPSLDDLLAQILKWFRENPFIWGPIVGALSLIILACCCCPRGNKPPVARAGFVQAQQSFRNMRGQGNVPNAMVVKG